MVTKDKKGLQESILSFEQEPIQENHENSGKIRETWGKPEKLLEWKTVDQTKQNSIRKNENSQAVVKQRNTSSLQQKPLSNVHQPEPGPQLVQNK